MKLKLLFLILAYSAVAQQKATVFFDFDQYHLNQDAIEKLNEITSGKAIEVSKIYGFCDWKGTNSYNDTLSLQRVNAVYRFLVEKGVKIQSGYELKGFGEDFQQSEIQSENRKVLVIYSETQTPQTTNNSEATLADQFKTSRIGDKILLKNINFHNNSAVVVQRSKPALYDLLCLLEDNPNLKIEIQGHICCQVVGDVNDVSTARARAIYNFLIRNKINRKRLSFKGFGTSRPIHKIPEKSESEADENRRVEIMIVEN
jgi:outer membrane protein OmpA-like peptidoglycan-associated protein